MRKGENIATAIVTVERTETGGIGNDEMHVEIGELPAADEQAILWIVNVMTEGEVAAVACGGALVAGLVALVAAGVQIEDDGFAIDLGADAEAEIEGAEESIEETRMAG